MWNQSNDIIVQGVRAPWLDCIGWPLTCFNTKRPCGTASATIGGCWEVHTKEGLLLGFLKFHKSPLPFRPEAASSSFVRYLTILSVCPLASLPLPDLPASSDSQQTCLPSHFGILLPASSRSCRPPGSLFPAIKRNLFHRLCCSSVLVLGETATERSTCGWWISPSDPFSLKKTLNIPPLQRCFVWHVLRGSTQGLTLSTSVSKALNDVRIFVSTSQFQGGPVVKHTWSYVAHRHQDKWNS